MIKYVRHVLSNGLTVICNTDRSTPFVAVNVLYKVGSLNESPQRTGFAHLFEHLMFSGSVHIADYDKEVQVAGGESNAFTTNDYTNYYITIPAANLETALWLESDRMLQLNFCQQALDIQKNVVIEEYKQRYLNAPYGNVWLLLRPLAYKVHPYRWPTIGVSPAHIEKATLDDVKDFYNRYYHPGNAVLSFSGNIEETTALKLSEKWFGDIPAFPKSPDIIPQEPRQTQERRLVKKNNNVPADAIYKVYHMGQRLSDNFYTCDIISDILSNGQSSRLYQHLVKDKRIFSELDAYVTGEADPGLFVISGKLSENITPTCAEQAIQDEIDHFIEAPITTKELEKIIHKTESRISFSEINYQNKASNLAYFEFLGDLELINKEAQHYSHRDVAEIKETARQLFRSENCSTLLYLK